VTVRTFGRKGCDDGAMARRRDAFLAEEQARKARLSDEAAAAPVQRAGSGTSATGPATGREKSLGLAYVFWFGCGTVGAHRFYLGFPVSGAIQAGLWFGSWMMVVGGFLIAALGALAAGVWIVSDVFVIPSLCRRANARSQERTVAYTFA
jgi:TM2 domain-containing membrane protein YozV